MNLIEYRGAREADLPELWSLWRLFAEECRLARPGVFRADTDSAEAEAWLARRVASGCVECACSEGVVRGMLVWERQDFPRGILAEARSAAGIVAVVVHPDWRRRGLGRTLVERLARQVGPEQPIELSVWDFAQDALAFWRALGFSPRSHRLERLSQRTGAQL